MKKIIVGFIVLSIIISGGIFTSYFIAKKQATKVTESFPGQLSPLHTHLALFGDTEITPCWIFRAEYSNYMTGATFDVPVSFWGKVLRVPPKSKMPN